jgi:HPt (histidine-containing phosphotransfer) domain-containing protein
MTTHGEPPVDLEGFRSTMREAGIEEVVGEALETFVSESQVRYTHLKAAIAAERIEAIRAAAHALKSSSGNIHAHGLASLLHQLEKSAENADADMDAITMRFDQVAPAFEAVMTYLAEADIEP